MMQFEISGTQRRRNMLKKIVKMLGLIKKSAHVIYECPLSRIPDAPQKRSKGSIMIAVQSKAVEYQDKIREAMDKLLFKGIVTVLVFFVFLIETSPKGFSASKCDEHN